MDAKPQRPARMLRVNDENVAPSIPMAKTIHQRNKSSPALSTMHGGGGLKAAPKRTAFGDLSNIVHNTRPSKDDTAISSKSELQSLVKASQPLQEKKSTTFFRPAQRPLSVAGLKGLLIGSSNTSVEAAPKSSTTDSSQPTQASNTRKVLIKRNTTIFKDPLLDTVQEIEARPNEPSQPPETSSTQLEQNTTHAQQQLLKPQHELPLPSTFGAAGDPIKEQHCSVPEVILPGISEVSLDPSVQPSHLDRDNSLRQEQLPTILNQHSDQTYPTSTMIEILPQTSALPPAQHMYQPIKVDSYFPQVVKPKLPTQAAPALLPSLAQPSVPHEPEEHWDDEDEEPYEEEGYVTARSYRSKSENTTGGATTVLFPQMNQKARREIASAKNLVEATRTAEEIEDESYDTSMVAEYGDEIFDYMKELEVKMLPNAHYMDNQHEIQWSMRAVLMDWLVQVHHRFNLLPETLFLCVNYIDRFLSCKVVSLGKLQLVGATAIFIAAKYEEINCPSVQEIVYMVDSGYTIDEILKAERFMLTMLQFELGWPGPMSFLRRISKADDYDLETRTLAKYFLEVTIMDERFIGSPPSFTAAASHCLARLMLHKGLWSAHHVYYSNYTFMQLRPLLSLLLECCEDPRKHHAAVYNKYCDKRYKRASAFVETEIARGFMLPNPTPLVKDFLQTNMLTYYDNSAYFRG